MPFKFVSTTMDTKTFMDFLFNATKAKLKKKCLTRKIVVSILHTFNMFLEKK